jgi:hypothetical protein
VVLDSAERIEAYSMRLKLGIVLGVRASFRHGFEGAGAAVGLGYFFVSGGLA